MSRSQPSQPYTANRPRVCRNCGALVGANESVCSACGAQQVDAESQQARARRPVYDMEAMRFARAILTRPATFSTIFLIANIFVAMLMWASSGFGWEAVLAFPQNVLLAYGAKVNFLINGAVNHQHQWWRFVTPIFIHVGFLHLLLNMYGLWQLGPLVERLYGSAKFVVFWVVTGICGVVASYITVRPGMHVSSLGRFLFKADDPVSAGASGALFGLVGVLFVFGIKFRHELPENFKRAFGTGMLPVILINFFIGYAGRNLIDNAAHVGGLISGAALAVVVDYRRPNVRDGVRIFWRVLQILALALVCISFLLVARNFRSTLGVAENVLPPESDSPKVAAYLDALNDAHRAFIRAFDERDAKKLDDAVKKLDEAPHLDEQSDALRDELRKLLVRERAFISLPQQQQQTRAALAEQKKILEDYKVWIEQRREWVKREGDRYGIELTNTSNQGQSGNENSQGGNQSNGNLQNSR